MYSIKKINANLWKCNVDLCYKLRKMTAIIRKLTPKNGKELMQVKNDSVRPFRTDVKNNSAWIKMGLVIVSLGLVMTLSITSDYLFFKELFVSSGIILFVTTINFFQN